MCPLRQAVTRMLLDPVASRIEGKRLLIVGEGVLQYLPFAALPEPGTGEHGKAPPLIANHEIITAPSASVMAVLRQETAGRRQAEKALLVLADPVFSADDARVVQTGDDRGNRVDHRIGHQGCTQTVRRHGRAGVSEAAFQPP